MILTGQSFSKAEYIAEPEHKRHFRQAMPEVSKVVKVVENLPKITAPARLNDNGEISFNQLIQIRETVCKICGVTVEEFMMRGKLPKPLFARCIFIYIIYHAAPNFKTGPLLVAINRDYCTVYHQLNQFNTKIKNPLFFNLYNQCATEVNILSDKLKTK